MRNNATTAHGEAWANWCKCGDRAHPQGRCPLPFCSCETFRPMTGWTHAETKDQAETEEQRTRRLEAHADPNPED